MQFVACYRELTKLKGRNYRNSTVIVKRGIKSSSLFLWQDLSDSVVHTNVP